METPIDAYLCSFMLIYANELLLPSDWLTVEEDTFSLGDEEDVTATSPASPVTPATIPSC